MPLSRSASVTAAASTPSRSIVPTTSERSAGSLTNGVAYADASAHSYSRVDESVVRLTAQSSPPCVEHPPHLVVDQEQRRERRRVVGLVLAGVVDRDRQVEESGDVPPARLDLLGTLDRGGRHEGDPQPAVGCERLLRREVVGVGLRHVDRQATCARGRVDQHQRTVVGAGDALDRHHDAGRGLVVRPGVRVDARLGDRHGVRRELALQHLRDRRGTVRAAPPWRTCG